MTRTLILPQIFPGPAASTLTAKVGAAAVATASGPFSEVHECLEQCKSRTICTVGTKNLSSRRTFCSFLFLSRASH